MHHLSINGTRASDLLEDPVLTARDSLMIRILASGATNREIAARLGLTEQTVKNRLSVIYGKLGLRNRLELAVYSNRIAASATTPRES